MPLPDHAPLLWGSSWCLPHLSFTDSPSPRLAASVDSCPRFISAPLDAISGVFLSLVTRLHNQCNFWIFSLNITFPPLQPCRGLTPSSLDMFVTFPLRLLSYPVAHEGSKSCQVDGQISVHHGPLSHSSCKSQRTS